MSVIIGKNQQKSNTYDQNNNCVIKHEKPNFFYKPWDWKDYEWVSINGKWILVKENFETSNNTEVSK
jgi:hypothetical protein